MPVRVPSNQIVTSKYTIGKEFIVESTYEDYQGYYYEFNSNYYAGKKFSTTAPKLVKVTSDKINPLVKNPKTSIYGKISKFNFLSLPFPKSISNVFENIPGDDSKYSTYYIKKTSNDGIIIRQIDKNTYDLYKNDPLYQTIEVKIDQGDVGITDEELNRAENQMPGFREWYLSGRAGG